MTDRGKDTKVKAASVKAADAEARAEAKIEEDIEAEAEVRAELRDGETSETVADPDAPPPVQTPNPISGT